MRGWSLLGLLSALLSAPQLFTRSRVALRAQRNPYDVLGLQRSSSYDDIRVAFRKLARTYHPDVPGTGDEDRFRSIREALEELATEEGRARWSVSRGSAPSSASSASSGYSYSSVYGSYREEPEPPRARREPPPRRQKAEKKARGPASHDAFLEKELKKAVREAKSRQAQRAKELKQRMKDVKQAYRKGVEQEIANAWSVINRFQDGRKQRSREQVARWKEKLRMAKSASVEQRHQDGESWVQKFNQVQREAEERREEMGRRYAQRWREFRETSPSEQAATPEKVKQEVEEILRRQDELISDRWEEMYKKMMKDLQRSINNEPKLWKDRFRMAMIQLGKGGQHIQKRWVRLFQDTMKELGEREMDQVSDRLAEFQHARSFTGKELEKRAKLLHAGKRLASLDVSSQRAMMNAIDQCRQAEISRLRWQAWNRKTWVKKFRQEQDRLYNCQQEEEMRLLEEFWEGVKASHLQEAESKT